MVHVQPTVHESNQFSRTGKLPESLKERRKLAQSSNIEKLKEVAEAFDSQHPNYQVAVARLQELRIEAQKSPISEGGEEDTSSDSTQQKQENEIDTPTVKEIIESLPGLNLSELEDLLEAERSGKGRKTAISAIEERIEEISEGGEE